ncbi:serine hydrolase domain-containing protein [Streptomyces sp. AJ-1]|uniref:serine hydrolase domain-containing protein n=1 Tax=Streptomyces sp. AJ-1 TaxID=3044384 RepID=UPI00249BE1C4|nr:serine hydrolase domain-containing protein [Streptomyces sp. AJ-1]MDI3346223.1 serine hydrolase domain-containing protein [Streptomyces sp. AJ-1]
MPQHPTRALALTLSIALATGAAALSPASAAPANHPTASPAATSTTPASPTAQPDTSHHQATLSALQDLVDKGTLPGASAEVRHREARWTAQVGQADTATGRERTPDDHFRGASITKTFIATVLLQLEAEGRLSLDDSVEEWLPGLVRGDGYDAEAITVRQLLNHTSGIANYTDDPEFIHRAAGPGFAEHRYDTHTPEELVALALTYPPYPEPESAPMYSNTNYVLAGMVIEAVTGRSYAREVTRRVIRPLKLGGTSFPGVDPTMPKPHPVAYSRLHQDEPDAAIHDATEQNMTWLGAAGDVISTAGDLNRFQRALVGGKLLPRAQMKAMFAEVPAGYGTGYGLGVEFAETSCGVKVVGKSGRTNGSVSAMVGTPDGRHQLTFNINGDWIGNGLLYVNVIEAEFCGKVLEPEEGRAGPVAH